MKLSKYINFKVFLISFAVGLLYIYLTDDYKKVNYSVSNANEHREEALCG